MSAEAGAACESAEVAARLARRLLANLDAVTDQLVEEITVQNPHYYEAALVSKTDLHASCRNSIERVLQLLGRCVPEGEDPYDAARQTGARRAQQRAALDLVLRSFRLGGRVVWSSALDVARQGEDVEPDELFDIATSVWTVVDTVSSEAADSYHRADRELLRADEQRRQVLIDGLLNGTGDDPAFADMALRTVRLPTTGSYAVVVGEYERNPSELIGPEEALAQHGLPSAWQSRSGGLVGIVALLDQSLERVTNALGLERVTNALGRECGRFGISPAVSHCVSIPQARDLAFLALRTVPRGSARTVTLDDNLPRALLARSPDLADRLVDRSLGPLLALPAVEWEQLLDTLSTWLKANRSAKLAAAHLFCHRNTVLNRIARIEALLARSVHGVDEAVWLSLALSAHSLRA